MHRKNLKKSLPDFSIFFGKTWCIYIFLWTITSSLISLKILYFKKVVFQKVPFNLSHDEKHLFLLLFFIFLYILLYAPSLERSLETG